MGLIAIVYMCILLCIPFIALAIPEKFYKVTSWFWFWAYIGNPFLVFMIQPKTGFEFFLLFLFSGLWFALVVASQQRLNSQRAK